MCSSKGNWLLFSMKQDANSMFPYSLAKYINLLTRHRLKVSHMSFLNLILEKFTSTSYYILWRLWSSFAVSLSFRCSSWKSYCYRKKNKKLDGLFDNLTYIFHRHSIIVMSFAESNSVITSHHLTLSIDLAKYFTTTYNISA